MSHTCSNPDHIDFLFHFQVLEQFFIRTSALRGFRKKSQKLKKSVFGLNCLENVVCRVMSVIPKYSRVGLATRHLCSTFSDPLFNQPSTDCTVSPSLILHVTYFSVSQREPRILSVSSRSKDLQRHLKFSSTYTSSF